MARRHGSNDLDRLVGVHGLNAAADAFFAVSLADSLFFNLSIEAARPRLLLYLAVTMAPFAVLAPLIGPFIDRVRGGQRTVLVATCLGRAALVIALSQDLRSLLLFPEAFGVLVLGKTYSVGRNATVPRLVVDDRFLVATNAKLARVGLVGGSIGGASAALVLTTGGASLVLRLAAVIFVAASLVATKISSADTWPRQQDRVAYHELHTVRLTRAVQAMGLLRGSIGLLTFLVAFALKRSGAPVWMFGLTLAAGGAGAIAATMASTRLRARFSEERILVITLVVPAAAGLLGALQFGLVTAVLVSATVGAVASSGRHSFDALVQRTAPNANLARAFASFETRFQLYWIGGATLVVVGQPAPRLGLFAMGAVLAVAAGFVHLGLNESDRFEAPPSILAAVSRLVLEDAPEHSTPVAVLDAAEGLLRGGSPGAAMVTAAAALDAFRGGGADNGTDPSIERIAASIARLRDVALAGGRLTDAECERAIAEVRGVVTPAV